jgi:hypothetical protein
MQLRMVHYKGQAPPKGTGPKRSTQSRQPVVVSPVQLCSRSYSHHATSSSCSSSSSSSSGSSRGGGGGVPAVPGHTSRTGSNMVQHGNHYTCTVRLTTHTDSRYRMQNTQAAVQPTLHTYQ